MNQMIWITILLLFLSGCIMSDATIDIKLQKIGLLPATVYQSRTSVSVDYPTIIVLMNKVGRTGELIIFKLRNENPMIESLSKIPNLYKLGVIGMPMYDQEWFDTGWPPAGLDYTTLISGQALDYLDVHQESLDEEDWPATASHIAINNVNGFVQTVLSTPLLKMGKINVGSLFEDIWTQVYFPLDTDELKSIPHLKYLWFEDFIRYQGYVLRDIFEVQVFRTDVASSVERLVVSWIGWQRRVGYNYTANIFENETQIVRKVHNNPSTGLPYTEVEISAISNLYCAYTYCVLGSSIGEGNISFKSANWTDNPVSN